MYVGDYSAPVTLTQKTIQFWDAPRLIEIRVQDGELHLWDVVEDGKPKIDFGTLTMGSQSDSEVEFKGRYGDKYTFKMSNGVATALSFGLNAVACPYVNGSREKALAKEALPTEPTNK